MMCFELVARPIFVAPLIPETELPATWSTTFFSNSKVQNKITIGFKIKSVLHFFNASLCRCIWHKDDFSRKKLGQNIC